MSDKYTISIQEYFKEIWGDRPIRGDAEFDGAEMITFATRYQLQYIRSTGDGDLFEKFVKENKISGGGIEDEIKEMKARGKS